jgi:hypothetical protein
MGAVDWRQRLDEAGATPPLVVTAHTFIKKWATASQPVLLRCDNDREYVVKGTQAGRMVVNDQVVARLGRLAGAPVGVPALVDVPQGLIDAEPEMQHIAAGISHGTEFLVGCSERQSYEHASEVANQPRFAALAFLFGWMHAGDHQFLYENAHPHLVHSVDHGHFFPNGPNWDSGSLAGAVPPEVDGGIVAGASLSAALIDTARAAFRPAADSAIAASVAAAPPSWGITEDEGEALCSYIANRRDVLFA